MSNLNGKQYRSIMRWIHILGSIIIGTYIYSPYTSDPTFSLVVQVGVIPVLGLSGILMWQQGRVMKWLRQRGDDQRTASSS